MDARDVKLTVPDSLAREAEANGLFTPEAPEPSNQSSTAVDHQVPSPTPEDIYRLIKEQIAPCFPELARCRSTAQLMASSVYRAVEVAVRAVLETPEVGDFTDEPAPARDRYRFL